MNEIADWLKNSYIKFLKNGECIHCGGWGTTGSGYCANCSGTGNAQEQDIIKYLKKKND